MDQGYISTLTVQGNDGVVHSVIDHQEERDVAERRCENLVQFGKEQKVPFKLVLRQGGEAIKQWEHKL